MPNIIITGISKGIGKSLLQVYLNDKANKVIGISRNASQSEYNNDHYTQQFIPIDCDLLEIENKITYIQEIISNTMPNIDVLINNAGILINKSFDTISTQEALNIIYLNTIVPAFLIKNLMFFLEKSQHAHVVNIGSMGGYQGSIKFSGLSWYSVSKAALGCLTECLAEEYKHKNIAFNCLAIGSVNTEMLQQAFPDYRAVVEPIDIANFIANFALKGHKVVNGKIIPIALNNP